jgi:hypothetical protein
MQLSFYQKTLMQKQGIAPLILNLWEESNPWITYGAENILIHH